MDDDFRTPFGTAADLSIWDGLKMEDRFKPMKLTSKEKIIGEDNEEITLPPREERPRKVETKKVKTELPKQSIREMPGVQEAIINPTELKSIAIRLLPTVEKLEEGQRYDELCQKAIDMAFTFLNVWDKKVSIERR